MVPFWGSFWIRVFFPLVIYSHMSVFWKHQFISIASLSWMEVNFFKKTSIHVCHHSQLFSNLVLFLLLVWLNFCLRSFFVSFKHIFPVSNPFGLCYIIIVPIFCSKIVLFSCHPVVGMSLCILSLLAGRIFFVLLECPVLSVLFYLVSKFF